MSNLVPDLRTDKNGKIVKKWVKPTDGSSSASDKVPAPQLKSSTPKPSTPLPAAPEMTEEAHQRYSKELSYDVVGKRKIFKKKHETELVKRIRDEGTLTDQALGSITNTMGMFSAGERMQDYDYNAFLLGESYAKKYGEDGINRDSGTVFNAALCALMYNKRREYAHPLKKIETQEELDKNTAVLRFILDPAHSQYLKEVTFQASDHYKEEHAIVPINPYLIDFIKENPEKINGINDYVAQRGLGRFKASIDEMSVYLEETEETAVLSDGWL